MPPRSTATWLDSQYNNRVRVPEFAAHFARWQRDSATARLQSGVALDVAYGKGANECLDVFRPQVSPGLTIRPAPILVFLHGGYWRSLSKFDHSFVAPAFTRAGAVVVVPDYSLCPGDPVGSVTVPAIALQCARALAFVSHNAAAWGGDPAHIVVAGHSAGGHLAALLAVCQWPKLGPSLPAQLLKGVLSVSGLHELESIRCTPYLQESLRLTAADARRASPAWMPAPSGGQACEVAAYCGGAESEEFIRHNQLLQDTWGRRAVPTCATVPGANHFTVLDALCDPAQALHQTALHLLGLKGTGTSGHPQEQRKPPGGELQRQVDVS